MKKTTFYSLIAAVFLLLAGTVYGASNSSRGYVFDVSSEGRALIKFDNARMDSQKTGEESNSWVYMIDASPEGRNLVRFDNDKMASQKVGTEDMRDTTSNYGIAPTWGDAREKESFYDLNIFGH